MQRHLSLDIIQRYLEPRGYLFENIPSQVSSANLLKITSPNGKTFITSRLRLPPPLTSSTAHSLSTNKSNTYDLARQLSINVPITLEVGGSTKYTHNHKETLLKEMGTVVVKPQISSGSRGLTLDVVNAEDLTLALQNALEVSPTALIQKQFYGEEVRFVTIDGKVKVAMIREKAHVIGDGVRTVRQLIEVENKSRRNITNTLVEYPLLDGNLIEKELLESSKIPQFNERIELNKSTMIRGGASVKDVLEKVHSSYIDIVEKISKEFGSGYLAVDLMLSDYSVEANKDNYVFIEVNVSPALSMFYSCRDGRHIPIVERYIGPLFERVLA